MNAENKVIPFIYDESPVRVILDEAGEPWWVAKDICRILGVINTAQATEYLDDDEKGISKTYTPGGEQEMAIISESGLYTLLIRSNKPQAKPFRRWVTHDVLPSIRKTGAYAEPTHSQNQTQIPPEMFLVFDKILTVLDRMVTVLNGMEAQHADRKKPRVYNYNKNNAPTERAQDAAGAPAFEDLHAVWQKRGTGEVIRRFILDHIALNKNALTQLYEIWCVYKQYCATNNVKPLGRNTFYDALYQAFAGYSRIISSRPKLYITGIFLKE